MTSTIPTKRVIGYVDGFNLYYGLRDKKWQRFYWLNIQEMLRLLLRPGQTLVATKYFSTIIQQPADKNRRQVAFLDALNTLNDFSIFYGHYMSDTRQCVNCGYTYITHHEKMTDVNIAVEMLDDAFADRFDVALLVSADSDLVRAVEKVRKLSAAKRVLVAFPPKRHSADLAKVCDGPIHIAANVLGKSQFPAEVLTHGGHVTRRPIEWY
jgi:uncharacterized LabA/DUF88 family protein